MVCPRCEEGTLNRMSFKNSGKQGYLCDFCNTVWLENENLNRNTGHPFDSLNQGESIEYILEEAEDKDQEHRSVQFPESK